MDKDEKLNQMLIDLDKIIGLFKKMENASLEDINLLKDESDLLHKELKKRYDEQDTPETDTPEA